MGEKSGSSGDSYIGSMISLTSKSEIRYEGILYAIDAENSNIYLQDVRSFGTEGRKKDGPQIHASDKVYDYIIFRGSDIKDLQVKSSPPAHTSSQLHSDPAIISLQSQYSLPTSVSTQFSPAGDSSLSDMNSQVTYSGVIPSPFQGGMPPIYQAGANLGAWCHPPSSPGANGIGVGLPMYWQGYYNPPGGLSHLHQQPIPFQTHPGMPFSLAHQYQLQQSSAPSSSLMGLPASLAFTSPLHQLVTVSTNSSVSSVVSAPMPVDTVVSSGSTTIISDAVSTLLSVPQSTAVSSSVTSASSKQEVSVIVTPASNKPRIVSVSTLSSQAISQPTSTLVGPTLLNLSTSEPLTLVTPGQLLQPVGFIPSSICQTSVEEYKVSRLPNLTSRPLIERSSNSHPQAMPSQPLLPLPASSSQQKPSEQILHGAVQFIEDFDFIAMNEKFNKDEVWGQLGKGESKDNLEDREEREIANENTEERSLGQSSISFQVSSRKPTYTKDDFFDSISCDALDRGGRSERTKFSEQRKIDTQTFGHYSLRSRMGHEGRGNHGYRGNIKGYHYSGRGN